MKTALFVLSVLLFLSLAVAPARAKGGWTPEEAIEAVHMGLVTAYEPCADGFSVALDDGFSAMLDPDDPIPAAFRDDTGVSRKPAASNGGIALLSLESGKTTWVRARLGVRISGSLVMGGTVRSLTEAFDLIPAGDPAAYAAMGKDNPAAAPDAVYIPCAPVPSYYYLYLNAPFFRESVDCLYRSTGAGYGRGKNAEYLVDMAYGFQERGGFQTILVRKSRYMQ